MACVRDQTGEQETEYAEFRQPEGRQAAESIRVRQPGDSQQSDEPLAAEKGADYPLHFDGENSYPECIRCGSCCQVNVLAMTHEEVRRIRDYIAEHDIHPIDRGKKGCCLESPDGNGCMVWPARAQVCRLHNCHVSRIEILRRNPSIHVPDDIPLVDLHECFINGREIDPRYQ